MEIRNQSFHGYRNHPTAVRRLVAEDVESGRVVALGTVVRFQFGLADGVVVIERALDRARPEWRSNPVEHLTNFPVPRPDHLYLMQIRAKACEALNWDPKECATRPGR